MGERAELNDKETASSSGKKTVMQLPLIQEPQLYQCRFTGSRCLCQKQARGDLRPQMQS